MDTYQQVMPGMEADAATAFSALGGRRWQGPGNGQPPKVA
jgi:hypothetical protein